MDLGNIIFLVLFAALVIGLAARVSYSINAATKREQERQRSELEFNVNRVNTAVLGLRSDSQVLPRYNDAVLEISRAERAATSAREALDKNLTEPAREQIGLADKHLAAAELLLEGKSAQPVAAEPEPVQVVASAPPVAVPALPAAPASPVPATPQAEPLQTPEAIVLKVTGGLKVLDGILFGCSMFLTFVSVIFMISIFVTMEDGETDLEVPLVVMLLVTFLMLATCITGLIRGGMSMDSYDPASIKRRAEKAAMSAS